MRIKLTIPSRSCRVMQGEREDMKEYNVYIAGGEKITTISATCISKACKSFIQMLNKQAKYKRESKEYASIRYNDNYTICSDFVVMEV